MGDFNLALVIVAVVVCVLVLLFNVYLLVNYQHPDDVNQAYLPKAVVVLGLSVAAISILMLPADVANRQACHHALYSGIGIACLPLGLIFSFIRCPKAVITHSRHSISRWGFDIKFVIAKSFTFLALCFGILITVCETCNLEIVF
ncbi:LIMR family protein [Acorus gramineus]|uniref:LIMR family protein n=1 Tax=Acorus gramineus TaxID=55184 RepID=A0AAV9ANP1_ACOGR|nr:LIMR family protein [Acorus gramineus]